MRRSAVAAALLVAAFTSTATAQAWPPLAPLRADETVTLAFVEERFAAFLTEPMRLRGTITLNGAGRMTRTVQDPIAERLIIDGQQVTIERPPGQVTARISLSANPPIQSMVTALRALANNDRRSLEALFTADVQLGQSGWTMTLTPKSAATRRAVSSVALAGTAVDLRRIEVVEADGARSVIALERQ